MISTAAGFEVCKLMTC